MTELESKALTLLEEISVGFEADKASVMRLDGQIREVSAMTSKHLAALAGAVGQVGGSVEKLRAQINTMVEGKLEISLASAQQDIGSVSNKLVSLYETSGSVETIDAATEAFIERRDKVVGALDEIHDEVGISFGQLDHELEQVGDAIEMSTAVLDEAVEQQIDNLEAAIESNVVVPVNEAATALTEEWSNSINEEVEARVEQVFAEVQAQIEQPLLEAISQIEDIVRAEFNSLRDELVGGDVEGGQQRVALEQSIDALKEALAPLESAFESFADLAGVVGIQVG